jgi:hypothetical protein
MVSLAQEISPQEISLQEISPQEISPPGNLFTQEISPPRKAQSLLNNNPCSINQMPFRAPK